MKLVVSTTSELMRRPLSLSYQKRSTKSSVHHSLSSVDIEVPPIKSVSGISENVVIVSVLLLDTANISLDLRLISLMQVATIISKQTSNTAHTLIGWNNTVTSTDGPRAIKSERRSMDIRSSHGIGDISGRRWQQGSKNSVGLLQNMSGSKRQSKRGNICKKNMDVLG